MRAGGGNHECAGSRRFLARRMVRRVTGRMTTFRAGVAREPREGRKRVGSCSTRLSIHQPHAARIDVSTGSYESPSRYEEEVDIVEESGPPLPPSLPPPLPSLSLPRRRRRRGGRRVAVAFAFAVAFAVVSTPFLFLSSVLLLPRSSLLP